MKPAPPVTTIFTVSSAAPLARLHTVVANKARLARLVP
jgi:hypothetical protein